MCEAGGIPLVPAARRGAWRTGTSKNAWHPWIKFLFSLLGLEMVSNDIVRLHLKEKNPGELAV
jgi:hypothetical protein